MVTLVIDHGAGRRVQSETENSATGRAAAPSAAPPAAPPAAPMPQVSVNGVVIARKAIAAEVQNYPAANPGEGWRAATRALVIRELLLQEARRLQLAPVQELDPDGRKETEDDALVRALIAQEVAVPQADEATLERFYAANAARFTTPPLYEADHILIAARQDDAAAFAAARERAVALAAQLAATPERFAELARAHSACPSAALGGSLGQIGPGDTTADFERALARLAPGAISGPVETRYGVHLIRLNRRIDGQRLPFAAVRERIRTYLEEHVQRQAAKQYIALLIGRAEICGIVLDGAETPLVQ